MPSYEDVTDPIITDSTGQQILTAINNLKNAVAPSDAYLDIELTLTTSGWSNMSPSTYTWSSENVTSECGIEVYFANGSESVESTPYIQYEKGSQSVVFTAPTKPTANIPVIVRILKAKAESVTTINAEMVATDAISGASNVQDALESVNTSMGNISEQIGTLNSKISTSTATVTFVQNVTEDSNLTVKKSGNVVCINGRIKILADISGLGAVLFALPSGYYGSNDATIVAYATNYNGSPAPTFLCNVKGTTGEIKTGFGSSNIGANSYMYFSVSYCV